MNWLPIILLPVCAAVLAMFLFYFTHSFYNKQKIGYAWFNWILTAIWSFALIAAFAWLGYGLGQPTPPENILVFFALMLVGSIMLFMINLATLDRRRIRNSGI